MTTTMVNLRVEAEAEARRLAAARAIDQAERERPKDDARAASAHAGRAVVGRARGARRREMLAGRTLFIWQVACEDAAGRTSPAAIVAMLVSVDFASAGRGGRSVLRTLVDAVAANVPEPFARAMNKVHRGMVETARAHALARLERERAIAADIARSPRGAVYQSGLFDRRSDRDHQQRNADAQQAEDLARGRIAAASAAATIVAVRPTLLLVLAA
jgi:hypothetical protein